MFERQPTHIALLSWGAVFCLIAAICVIMSKNIKKEKQRWMLYMELSAALLLASDALAWVFRGYPGNIGYYMVRISNFLVFVITDILLLLFHFYVCSSLFHTEERNRIHRVKIGTALCIAGIVFVILSQFTGLYYDFDADNYYHRNSGYILSMLIPVAGMAIDFSLLVQYRKNISKRLFLSMNSYIVLPICAAVVQIVDYGYSLINIAIGISMMLMYVAVIEEQNTEMNNLVKSKQETTEKLEIATILNRCVAELTSNTGIDQAIQHLLEIINDYFQGDRTYIFEINFEHDTIQNTYEYVKGEVTQQKDNLQEVPIEVISVWMKAFQESHAYYIEDLEQHRNTAYYDILKGQDIRQLLAVPLLKDGIIIGFLGIDNPHSHNKDVTLLSSIQYFITNSLQRKKEEEYLKYLSYRDMLTMLFNRNKYIELLEEQEEKSVKKTGILYMDLNGLKEMNDQEGHEAGDRLIRKAAEVIQDIFPEQAYRIGGDEFVIISQNVERDVFEQKVEFLHESMIKNDVSIATGSVWSESATGLDQMIEEADERMYVEKERQHRELRMSEQTGHIKRRRTQR